MSAQSIAQKKMYTLEDVIYDAQVYSFSSKLAETQAEVSYYQYQTYLGDLKPQISLYGNAPVYSKTYTSIIQPDGSLKYLPIRQNQMSTGVSIEQTLPFSGGQLSLNSELSQFNDYETHFKQYYATPVFLRYQQPLFGFNQFKWKKKIEPLKLEFARRQLLESKEEIALQSVKLFFELLEAQNRIEISKANLSYTTGNLSIEKKRVSLGTTSQDRVLQLEVQMMQSQQDLDKARFDQQNASYTLKSFMGASDSLEYVLTAPSAINNFTVNIEQAVELVKKNNSQQFEAALKKLEAERNIQQAGAQDRIVNLQVSYGLNGTSYALNNVYSGSLEQVKTSVGFSIPVVDWGRRKARMATAKTEAKLAEYNNRLNQMNLMQQVVTLVNNINLLRNNIQLAKQTDSVARIRFSISDQLYKHGNLSVMEMKVAQSEKDETNRFYLSTLRDFWISYYMLRKITLYDFMSGTSLAAPLKN
jgi:outer membrane protein TolC